jgi:hypothetical protein
VGPVINAISCDIAKRHVPKKKQIDMEVPQQIDEEAAWIYSLLETLQGMDSHMPTLEEQWELCPEGYSAPSEWGDPLDVGPVQRFKDAMDNRQSMAKPQNCSAEMMADIQLALTEVPALDFIMRRLVEARQFLAINAVLYQVRQKFGRFGEHAIIGLCSLPWCRAYGECYKDSMMWCPTHRHLGVHHQRRKEDARCRMVSLCLCWDCDRDIDGHVEAIFRARGARRPSVEWPTPPPPPPPFRRPHNISNSWCSPEFVGRAPTLSVVSWTGDPYRRNAALAPIGGRELLQSGSAVYHTFQYYSTKWGKCMYACA